MYKVLFKFVPVVPQPYQNQGLPTNCWYHIIIIIIIIIIVIIIIIIIIDRKETFGEA